MSGLRVSLTDLRAQAEKATPGKWQRWAGSGWPKWWAEYLGFEGEDGTRSGWPLAASEDGREALVKEDGYDELWLGVMRRSQDQAFVAAVSPDVVLALVDAVEAAQVVEEEASYGLVTERSRARLYNALALFGEAPEEPA